MICLTRGCIRCANKKAIPFVSSCSTKCSGVASSETPSASSTSALPVLLETLRFPCFATFMPAPARTKAAVVLMLNDCEPSPPVPQLSMKSPVTGMSSATSRMIEARPASSSAVSPFAFRATRKAAISLSVTSSANSSRAACCISSYRKCFASANFNNVSFIVRHSFVNSMNRLIICCPCGVPTDSGWNWIPNVGCVLCSSAMIVRSSVSAVMTSFVGKSFRATISE